MSKDQYIQWLELTIVNDVINDNLCKKLTHKCGIWCENHCRNKFNTKCLRQLAETDIWEN